MPFDLVAFYESQTATALSGVAGVADENYQVTGDDVMVQDVAPYLAGIMQIGATTPKYVEIRQPDLKVPHRFYKSAIQEQVSKNGYDALTNLFRRPLPLFPKEKMNAYVQNASNEVSLIITFLASGKTTQTALDAVNPTHMITGTTTTDTIAGVWTKQAVTWDQSLPYGEYAVVGMKSFQYKAANPMIGASRLVLPNNSWRPGVPFTIMDGANTLVDHDNYGAMELEWPLMQDITFKHDQMPQYIETITPAAMTDGSFNLLLQKVK